MAHAREETSSLKFNGNRTSALASVAWPYLSTARCARRAESQTRRADQLNRPRSVREQSAEAAMRCGAVSRAGVFAFGQETEKITRAMRCDGRMQNGSQRKAYQQRTDERISQGAHQYNSSEQALALTRIGTTQLVDMVRWRCIATHALHIGGGRSCSVVDPLYCAASCFSLECEKKYTLNLKRPGKRQR